MKPKVMVGSTVDRRNVHRQRGHLIINGRSACGLINPRMTRFKIKRAAVMDCEKCQEALNRGTIRLEG